MLENPAPGALVKGVEDYAILLAVLGWVDQTHSDFNKVRSEAIRAVREAFEAEGILLAQPTQIALHWTDPRRDEAPASRKPSAAEMREIKDTSRDTTIERKVAQQRAESDSDLLTEAAPRE